MLPMCLVFHVTFGVVFNTFQPLVTFCLWITLGIGSYRLGSIRIHVAAIFECSLSIRLRWEATSSVLVLVGLFLSSCGLAFVI